MHGLDQSITTSLTRSVVVVGPTPPEFEHLLTDDALEFLGALMRRVRPAIALAYGAESTERATPAEFNHSARDLNRFDPQVEVDGLPVSAGVFDFGLFVYHNAAPFRAVRRRTSSCRNSTVHATRRSGRTSSWQRRTRSVCREVRSAPGCDGLNRGQRPPFVEDVRPSISVA
jgi:hypothetical protein